MEEYSTVSINSQVHSWGLVRAGDRIVQTVRLEGAYANRERYLSVISLEPSTTAEDEGREEEPDYVILGIDRATPDPEGDLEEDVSIGLVVRLFWDFRISLDGDGGFSIRQLGTSSHLTFKPVSVQSLWTIIQTLHMICNRMRPKILSTNDLLDQSKFNSCEGFFYTVTSSQSCINEWHDMPDLLVRRPPSPTRRTDEGISMEEVIKTKLREVMKAVDLDSITAKAIRGQLETDLKVNLESYKSFIDKEMLVILGQMDPASRILDYLYLGSEWNASNLDELRQNGITHVLNVTREIDNFFPALFTYKNVREYDEETTDLLKYLIETYKFIKNAKESGGKVLVHCKMGISRSATVTISFVMKENNMNLVEALAMVKSRRNIVKPNKSFIKQLEVYEGMLNAIRHRHTKFDTLMPTTPGLYRSKSESSLEKKPGSDPVRVQVKVNIKKLSHFFDNQPNNDLSSLRPKSWSPPEHVSKAMLTSSSSSELADHDDCRCFGEFSREFHDYESDQSLSKSLQESHTGSMAEAKNEGLIMPVNSPTSLYNPACHCDIEVELQVPEEPVLIDDRRPSRETDQVVQRISNVSLQVNVERSKRSLTHPLRKGERDLRDQEPEMRNSEELSVKTLANMFDLKIGSVPLRPCSARLEDNNLFKRAKKREIQDPSSDC